jgi:hypothetical protein
MADSMFRYNFIFADTSVMFPLIFTFLLSQLTHLVNSFGDTSCFSIMKHHALMDGDMMIAGFFPLYTMGIDYSNTEPTEDENSIQ